MEYTTKAWNTLTFDNEWNISERNTKQHSEVILRRHTNARRGIEKVTANEDFVRSLASNIHFDLPLREAAAYTS